MKHLITGIISLTVMALQLQSQQGPSHEKWSELLQKHVSPYGKVDYKGFAGDEKLLDEYLAILSASHPRTSWKVDEQKAYWINAYNAFTIKLVLKHYPLKSIMDIKEGGKNAWNIAFIKIENKLYTLDYIEKNMLLSQFNDSRIHFAVNCTARSCPPLRNKAFSGANLEIELRLAARIFINDDRYNLLSENHLQLSQIFSWYKADFLKEESTLQVYIDKATPHINVSPNASLSYIDYDWSLNE